MIETEEQYNVFVKYCFIEWFIWGTWFNGPIYEEFFFTVLQYRYYLMFALNTYDKNNNEWTGETYFRGGRPLPADYTTNPLVSIFVGIDFIDTWLYFLTDSFLWWCCSHQENMILLNISRENVRHFLLILEVNVTLTACMILHLLQRIQGK